ncbi:hypothetical protein BDZ94DRAFT_300796 [Collybia nuda]|uniref:Zn(2)-C6 fungal-type domain-containing protein n=1 Tax=Collybia nuda TaxID=64659 RepID=A0A9P5YC54_9AGAR|nr:hypothetical protein BDZ94DRAFT_300796 [Collybia nuda]
MKGSHGYAHRESPSPFSEFHAILTMAPSVAGAVGTDLHDTRPLKRARKSGATKPRESEDQAYIENAPVDHIFIAEGNVSKKPGGKKAPLSCCECRRLKLKCDRSFPCASCKKRGCAEICPEGVLVSGKGTRFILANTEQLHTKIHDMSDRIRHLEEALESLQAQYSADPHPLLHTDFLGVKSTMGLYGGTQVGTEGSTPPMENGHDRDLRQPQMDVDALDRGSSEEAQKGLIIRNSPGNEGTDPFFSEVVRLSYSYPLPDNVSPEPNLPLRNYIRGKLPDRAEAEYLWDQARQNALWQ